MPKRTPPNKNQDVMIKKPSAKIHILLANWYEDEQIWRFLSYNDDIYKLYNNRWVIVRREMNDGDIWWGVRSTFTDTHENELNLIEKEIDLAKEAIAYLKKNWTKYET